ncbi:hypothetical protein [Gordonia sp. NPDC003429]
MTSLPIDAHGLIYRDTCIAEGFTDEDLRRSCRRGDIVRVVRGAFAPVTDRSPEELHRLAVIATARLGRLSSVVSHQSAVVMHRVPMLKPGLRRIHATTGSAAGGTRSATRHDHVGVIPPDHIVEIDGILITSLEYTAVDVACTATMGFAGALAAFDAALRLGACRATMERLLRATRRGVTVARRALHHADGKAESPGESWSRAQLIEAGLPLPRLQHEFRDIDGGLVARTDFDWAGRLVGEFDGAVKYQKHLRPGEDVTAAVLREKRREDALRGMGIMVVRWIWADLEHSTMVRKVHEWLVHLKLVVV